MDSMFIYNYAFPVLLNDKLYYLPRDTETINTEVLPAVLNGKYIDTSLSEEELNI
jgi:hypothetical protein